MRKMTPTTAFLGTFTLVHAVLSSTHLWSIKRSMEVTYLGEAHTWLDSAFQLLSNALLTPVFALVSHLGRDLLQGDTELILLLANSFLWALAARWIFTWLQLPRGTPGASR